MPAAGTAAEPPLRPAFLALRSAAFLRFFSAATTLGSRGLKVTFSSEYSVRHAGHLPLPSRLIFFQQNMHTWYPHSQGKKLRS